MSDRLLFCNDAFEVRVKMHAACSVLWIGFRRLHARDVEELLACVEEHIQAATPGGDAATVCALHFEHVHSDNVDAPDAGCILRIVGEMLKHRELLEKRVVGLCIQAKTIDPPAQAAFEMLLTLSPFASRFKLLDSAEAASTFLSKTIRRAASP